MAVRAQGCRIETDDGRSYLDACGGAMVMLLGHCHPRVVDAAAVDRDQLRLSLLVPNEPMLDLAERIARSSGELGGVLQLVRFKANESACSGGALLGLLGKPASRVPVADHLLPWLHARRSRCPVALAGAVRGRYTHRVRGGARARRPPAGRPSWGRALWRRPVAAFIIEPITGSSGALSICRLRPRAVRGGLHAAGCCWSGRIAARLRPPAAGSGRLTTPFGRDHLRQGDRGRRLPLSGWWRPPASATW